MSNEQLILEIRKRKFSILILLILIFSAALFIQFKYFNKYSSKVDFIISGNDMIDLGSYNPFEPERFFFDRSGTTRVYATLYATEIIDSLIDKFNLIKHYGITGDAKNIRETAYLAVVSNISAKKTDLNMLAITATDKDRRMAADLANDMIVQLNNFYKKRYLEKMNGKIKVYEKVMNNLNANDSLKHHQLTKMLKELKGVSMLYDSKSEAFEKFNEELIQVSNNIQNLALRSARTIGLYESAFSALENYNLETVSVVKKAMPQAGSGTFKKIIISFSVVVLSGCMLVLLLYYYLEAKPYLHLLITGTKFKDH